MEVKTMLVSVLLACLVCSGAQREGVSHENDIREEDLTRGSAGGSSGSGELMDSLSADSGKPPLILGTGKDADEEIAKKKLSGSEVDEETIRKAQKMADEDLLNGLNRILKNNETLEDVFRAENVYEII